MRTRFLAALLTLALAVCSFMPAHADSTTDAILAAVMKQVKADKWPIAMPYAGVDFKGRHYVCRVSDGKIMTSAASQRTGGVVGDWAEAATVPLNVRQNKAAQGGSWLLHRVKNVWRVVATNEGGGYSKASLQQAGVPADVIQKLNLETGE